MSKANDFSLVLSRETPLSFEEANYLVADLLERNRLFAAWEVYTRSGYFGFIYYINAMTCADYIKNLPF